MPVGKCMQHGNKQEELEMCAHLQGYDLIGIMEIWWVAPVTGVLKWKDTGSFRRTGRGEEEGVLPSMSVTF